MAEVVIALAAGFLGALVGSVVAVFASRDILSRIESCLKEVKAALKESLVLLEGKNLSPPELQFNNEDEVNRFTKNKLIRAWWIGEGGGKKKAEEE
jgi:hypothetical protein